MPQPDEADQAPICEPEAGDAVSVIVAPEAKLAEQVPPQLMPPGDEVTVPVPSPERVLETVTSGVKVAVADCGALIVTMQVPPPEQLAPLQPLKTAEAEGVAVSVTEVPGAKADVQVPLVQEIPAGDEVTVPAPLPATVTLSGTVKTALTEVTEVIGTVQVLLLPLQAPAQLVKPALVPAAAVRVTDWLFAKPALQVDPQEMPVGDELTLPVPLTATLSCSVLRMKLTVTVVAEPGVTWQVLLPLAQPATDQVPICEPLTGAAVSVTGCPEGKLAVHVPPHDKPAGTELTAPLPSPLLFTVTGTSGTNVAVTFCAWFIETVQGVVTPQPPPLKPVNPLPVVAAAVSTTDWP